MNSESSYSFIKSFCIVCLVVGVMGCSSMPTTNTGFLTETQQQTQYDENGLSVVWRVQTEESFSDADRAKLVDRLKTELKKALDNEEMNLPNNALKVRAAITRVETISPVLNWFTTILVFAPLDRGGAAVEFEAVNVKTQQTITQLNFAEWTPMSEFTSHYGNKLGPAERSLVAAAAEFAQKLKLAAAEIQLSAK